ncbi:RnfH family protein [Burkholderiaceae bacterium DAT-1]|nr:RnfH family protein [Burkholderiaceae bacterium DAT-1]
MSEKLSIEVAYASINAQCVLTLEVEPGTTVEAAIRLSGILTRFPEIDLGVNRVGIYSHPCKLDTRLRHRDRIEIYRPLTADPKEIRRKRAAEGKIMRSRRKFA